MEQSLYHCYRAYGDAADTDPMTIASDPTTGEAPHLHASGTVVSFESEAARENYVAQQVMNTTLPDGRARPRVTVITTEEARQFFDA